MNAIKFSGTTAACLLAYGQSLPKGRQAVIGRKPMADFVGVSDASVFRWLTGKGQLPIGLSQIKVWYWLESQGYLVDALKNLKINEPVVYALGYFLSYRLFDFETMYSTLAYSKPSSFLAMLRGEAKLSAIKMNTIDLLMQDTDKNLYRRLLEIVVVAAPEVVASVEVIAPAIEQNDLPKQANAVISNCVVDMISLLLPLAEKALSDSFTDEERRALRKAVPQDGLHRLFRVLGGLCSKENRRNVMEEGR